MDRKVKCPVDISRARIEALSASVPRTKCQVFHTSLAVPQVPILKSSLYVRDLCYIAFFTAMIAVLAQISIPLPHLSPNNLTKAGAYNPPDDILIPRGYPCVSKCVFFHVFRPPFFDNSPKNGHNKTVNR